MKLSVEAAFAGKRVLITGATGFVAKVVLERLMREVPGIGSLALLVRPSRAHPDATRRVHAEVLASRVFDRLRRSEPERLQQIVEHKLRVVCGDITMPDLGLPVVEFEQLAREVDVIVNVAASVDFREALDQALSINTLGLRHLGKLARAAGGIALVQVSTCYVNGFRSGLIEEGIAPTVRRHLPRHPDGAFEVEGLIESLQQAVAAVRDRVQEPQALKRALVELGMREARRHGWNDTYTFTKWLGEQVACREMRGGTLAIVRPSIVESALREPHPGWIEGMKVTDAIVLAYARGKTSFFPAKPSGVVDLMPVDMVAASIILATAQALARPGRRSIYQACSGTRNPIRVGECISLCVNELRSRPQAYPHLVRRPLTRSFHAVPRVAFLAGLAVADVVLRSADWVVRLLGAREHLRAFKALETTRELAEVFSFYASPNYLFDNRRLLAMAAEFDAADRRRFEVDPRQIDWVHYITCVHLAGLDRFAVKPPSPRASARKASASVPTTAAPEVY